MLVCCSCAHVRPIEHPVAIDRAAVTGSVINAQSFHKGGTLALSAFKPGPGAAANEQTDRLSLMLIKGIKESLSQHNTPFMLADGNDNSPNFVMAGYIEDYAQSPGVSRHILRKNEAALSVDGEIWFQETGEKVFIFQGVTNINLKKEDPMAKAYQLGRAIGDAIIFYAKE